MMGPYEIVAVVVVLLLLAIGLPAIVLLSNVLFPRLIQRASHYATVMPFRSMLVGLINFLFFSLVGTALASAGEGAALVGVLLWIALLSVVAVGIGAVARQVGARLLPERPEGPRRWLAGSLLLLGAAMLPVVGWIAVPIGVGLLGYGALIIALLRRGPAGPEELPAE